MKTAAVLTFERFSIDYQGRQQPLIQIIKLCSREVGKQVIPLLWVNSSFHNNTALWKTMSAPICWHICCSLPRLLMMTSSNGNIFRVTGPMCGEFTGHRWITRTRPVRRSLGVFFDLRLNKRLSKLSIRRWFEKPSLINAHYDVIVMVEALIKLDCR